MAHSRKEVSGKRASSSVDFMTYAGIAIVVLLVIILIYSRTSLKKSEDISRISNAIGGRAEFCAEYPFQCGRFDEIKTCTDIKDVVGINGFSCANAVMISGWDAAKKRAGSAEKSARSYTCVGYLDCAAGSSCCRPPALP
ncbi:MAG TPA: hypothetical protein VJI75_02900 [Candidatus Nanoarchaeia archaeon]|nr:hypothetical protein [Candidatus Nanoarchaeia archaeon]